MTSANSYSVGFPQGPEGTVLKRRSPRHSFSQNEGSVRTGPTPGPKGAQAVRFWGSEVESLRENVPVPARWPGGPVTGTCSPAGTRSSPAAGPAASPLCPSSGVCLVGPPTDVLGGFGVDWRRGGGSSPAWATVPVPSTAALLSATVTAASPGAPAPSTRRCVPAGWTGPAVPGSGGDGSGGRPFVEVTV